MKKIFLSAVITAVLAGRLCAAVAEDSKIFTPYFDMTMNEAAYMPSVGNIFSGGNVNTQVGLLSKITPKDQLFGLYNFNYSGQGFTPQDSKQFTDRSLTHSFTFEYRRNLGEKFRIRPGVAFTHDYSRTGANEAWKNGLYNMNTSGLQLAGDYTFDFEKNGVVSLTYLAKSVKFPNYTDLLREFQNPSNTANVNGGLQDQGIKQVTLRPAWGKWFGGLTYTQQDYDNQKVVANTGAYGDTKQQDKTTMVDFGFHHTLWIFELYPMVSYSMHSSNQNFMRYKSLGATPTSNLLDGSAPVTFVAKNYDYNEMTLSVPLDLNITGKWAIGGAFNMTSRAYTDRLRRDSDNNYVAGEKQKNLMSTLTGSIRKRINDTAMWRLYYALTVASSNNKFEQYMPNNYTGNTLGLSYQLSY
ncbi:MAG: hypothetical protein NTY45_13460 [Elusimicrobia bacterium]|nr:hypothetical protein [Elusimicrobiota bacterium]